MAKMLEGVKILDLSVYLPGPYCTMLLCDLGADVIKIEEPNQGDRLRELGKSFFSQINRGKRSVKINLKNTAGLEAFMKLAKNSDIILESFRPGVTKKLGIDYDAVRKINDRIIYCSISGFGQNGPMRDMPCHDLNIVGLTGIQDMMLIKGRSPVISSLSIADTASGSMSAVAILSALWQRANKKKGQYLDVSMYESCFSWQHFNASNLFDGLEYSAGEGVFNGGTAFYNLYETADGRYLSIGTLEPYFWSGLCKLIDKEHLLEKQFSIGEEADKVKDEMKEVFLTKTLNEWMNILGPAGLCVTPVLTLPESFEYPQAKFRNVLVSGGPNDAKLRQLNCPIKGDGIDEPVAGNGPKLGEHNIEVFMEIGLDKEQIMRLSDAGAFSR
ncbi:MAG: CoA transferase [Firmicutes bacterium]|nr:CoA transferase [Bacillota bacterium]